MKSRLKLITDAQIADIHERAFHMLENLGMKFDNDEACDCFKKAGATVDGRVCKIPRKVIENCLKTVPTRDEFTLYGRTPDRDWKISDHLPSLHPMTMAVKVIDPHDGKVRFASNDDLAKMTQILENLEHMSAASAPVTPQDVPMAAADWFTWATSLKHTTKHITGGCVGKKGVQDAAKMASIAIGSEEEFSKRPFISIWALTSPPLNADENMCNTLMEAARLGICNVITSGGILGMSSPITVESALVHTHAEVMATIALTQLVRPGAPIIFSSFIRGVDMKTMCVGMGSPESILMRGCMGQMSGFLNLPTQLPNMLRDGKVLDAQAGFETGMGGIVGALTADYLICTQLDSDLIVDFADFPYTNECMAQILRLIRPLDFSEARLNFNNMEKIGHGGSFLSSEHTVKFFRKELWKPELTERDNYDKWVSRGSKDIRQKSLEKALAIIDEVGGKALLSDEQCKAIDNIANASIDSAVRTNQS